MAFSVVCGACGAGFSIRDEVYAQKVAGRVVTMKCKHCSAPIRVDGTRPREEASAAGKGSRPSASSAKAPAPIEDLWAVSVEGMDDRELSTAELQQAIATGSVPATAIVWKQGMADWVAIRTLPELAEHLPEPPSNPRPKAAPAAPPPPAPAAPVKAAAPPAPAAHKPAPRPAPAAPRPAPAAGNPPRAVPRAPQPSRPEREPQVVAPAEPVVPPPPQATPEVRSTREGQSAPAPLSVQVAPPTLPPSAAAPWSIAAPAAPPAASPAAPEGHLAEQRPPKPGAYEDVSDNFDELDMTEALRRRPKWPWIAAAAVVVGLIIWLVLPEREAPLPPQVPAPNALVKSAERPAAPTASPPPPVRSTPSSSTPPPSGGSEDLKDAFARSLGKSKNP